MLRDLGIPDCLSDSHIAPGFLHLTNGGIIFLVYDSVLVLAPSTLIDMWRAHLYCIFKKAKITLKYLTLEPKSCTFCGVSIRGDPCGVSWSIDTASIEYWKHRMQKRPPNSPRSFFSILGFLRFALPVLNIHRRHLGRLTKVQSELGVVENWDKCFSCLEEPLTDAIKILFQLIPRYSHRKTHLSAARQEPIFFAVDATPKRVAAWQIEVARPNVMKKVEYTIWKDHGIDVA